MQAALFRIEQLRGAFGRGDTLTAFDDLRQLPSKGRIALASFMETFAQYFLGRMGLLRAPPDIDRCAAERVQPLRLCQANLCRARELFTGYLDGGLQPPGP